MACPAIPTCPLAVAESERVLPAVIDEMEVGRRVSPRLRVCFEVTDAESTTRELVEAGAVAAKGQLDGARAHLLLGEPGADHRALFRLLNRAHHAKGHDVLAQLGVDDGLQGLGDLFGGGH